MSTNRELYFQYKKEGIPDTVIYFALEECNSFNHLQLTNNFDKDIKDEKRFVEAMNRYQNGEMIEYIFNKAYFLSRSFYVDTNVLIPRQETEQLVLNSIDLIKKTFNSKLLKIADVCTGSGVIGISIAHVFKDSKITLSDISTDVLAVSLRNVYEHGVKNVQCVQSDMIDQFVEEGSRFDVIICNPPYIEDKKTIDEKTWKQEPHLALLAKPGTLFYEKLLKDYLKIVNDKYLLCFEIGEDLEEPLTSLVKRYCKDCSFHFEKDMYGRTRFLYIKGEK